jgi:hypothetical protein
MDKFMTNEKVWFCEDYEYDQLSIGVIIRKSKFENNKQYYEISRPSYANPDEMETIQLKEQFILKESDKRINKYKIIKSYLDSNNLSSEISPYKELARIFIKGNSRTRIYIKSLFLKCKKPANYLYHVIIIGFIKLLLGDILSHFPNMHTIYMLNMNNKRLKNELEIIKSINSSSRSLDKYNKTIEINMLKIIELKKEVSQINRSIVATIISIISILIAIYAKK